MSSTNTDFSQCHAGIISQLMRFGGLPGLVDTPAAARTLAEDTLRFFHQAVQGHHTEEERDLFPAVLAHATPGAELEKIRAAVERLTQEHRQIEARWARLEPAVACIAQGESAALDAAAVETLVLDYGAHAAFEESEFLPLCRTILARKRKQVTLSDLSHHVPWAPTEPGEI